MLAAAGILLHAIRRSTEAVESPVADQGHPYLQVLRTHDNGKTWGEIGYQPLETSRLPCYITVAGTGNKMLVTLAYSGGSGVDIYTSEFRR